ncbi:MAG: dTDP-4-amino-4,6-dideoxygalactose transaminase [Anaerolineaceae bacterium]|nr:dTDP-4-amino-4,6-dideoxygalactose transaminase [Anaerolineaceae bacterium]
MNGITIDFNRPYQTGRELDYIAEAYAKSHISGDGYFSKECQGLLEKELRAKKVVLTTSCTHALEMAALLLNFEPGDEVIIPSFTFVSTVNAFVLRGAIPVFIDINPRTLNMDENLLEDLITSKTKAVTPVHYAGVGCEMDRILSVTQRHGINIVEDNAHGLFGKYKGKFLGTFGNLATQSFHETKNISCGEGGALVINDPELIERAEVIREKGTNRSKFFRGMVDKYTWIDVGSSYLPSDILAAVLYAQLQERKSIQAKRERIWNYYKESLSDWAEDIEVQTPFVPEYCQQAYHMYYLILPSLGIRQALIKHLRKQGIVSVFHYQPLHLSSMGINFGGKKGDCPITERISDRLLRLPFHNYLTQSDQDIVIQGIFSFKF